MKENTKEHLKKLLERIEKTTEQVMSTRGYGSEAARLKIIEELLKEQVVNENLGTSTRQVR